MSEIDAAAEFAPPPGVAWFVEEGWDFVPVESPDVRVRREHRWLDSVGMIETRAGQLPERFQMHIWIESAHRLTFSFEVSDPERVTLVFAGSPDDDLEDALNRVTKVRDLSWWRTVAVRWALMHAFTRQIAIDQGLADLPPRAQKIDWGRADKQVEEFRAVPTARESEIAQLPKRGRITPELLREVARVYREAFARGEAPTEAVAAFFGKPRSTAGRWVANARRSGALGPADGPRAGEASDE